MLDARRYRKQAIYDLALILAVVYDFRMNFIYITNVVSISDVITRATIAPVTAKPAIFLFPLRTFRGCSLSALEQCTNLL